MKPMLADNYEGDPDVAIRDTGWALDLKLNGRRLLIDASGSKIRAFNRKGERTDIPPRVAADLGTIVELGAIVDGEYMSQGDGCLHLFDLVSCGTLVTPATPWHERRDVLESLFDPKVWKPRSVKLLPTARTTARKRTMAKRIWQNGYEGYILKRTDGRYAEGPKRSPLWRKVKNVRTVDCVIRSFGVDKQNMQVEVYDENGDAVAIGECSRLEGEAPRAKRGDVIEVAFLDAGSPLAPRLYQPHAKRIRTDEKDPDECTIDQLDGCWSRKDVMA